MEVFEVIQNYILFLRHKGYYVSFSDFSDNFYPFTEKLLAHEIHLHSICSYLKSNPQTVGMCVTAKRKLAACKIKKPTYSCCYAGVEEYIYPVYINGKRIICIHVSGYRNNIARSKRQMKKTKQLCSEIFDELYTQLENKKPTIKTVESFIQPLICLIEKFYNESKTDYKTSDYISPSNAIYIKALKYINENFMNNISANTLAKELGYSESYIRAAFKKESGTSLQNKINDIRLQNAKFLLKNTPLTVTDISLQCGFCDSNYFSCIFKKNFGLSPLKYKKEQIN